MWSPRGLRCRGHGAPPGPVALRLHAGIFCVSLWPPWGGGTGWRRPHEFPPTSSLQPPWAQPPREHLLLLSGYCPWDLVPPCFPVPKHCPTFQLLLSSGAQSSDASSRKPSLALLSWLRTSLFPGPLPACHKAQSFVSCYISPPHPPVRRQWQWRSNLCAHSTQHRAWH